MKIPSDSPSYWMEVPITLGDTSQLPSKASVVVIGSGLSGVSVAYFLQKRGLEDVVLVDYRPEQSASYRNCGHILYGTVESMKAMVEIHGEAKARELWQFSVDICNRVETTMLEHEIDADYKRDGYLVISISEVEDRECRESVELLNRMGYESSYVDAPTIRQQGFNDCFGARFEAGSAQAHPVKFRNGVLKEFLRLGGKYYSDVQVQSLHETPEGVQIQTARGRAPGDRGVIHADAAVIAANAYSPLFSDFFSSRGLIDPFRGQIIASQPLQHAFPVKYPHSFDHGYEYALISTDNRLILGGWRNHSSTGEVGTYSLEVNPHIEQGLQNFALKHYAIDEPLRWEYSWSGIMAASRTGLPFIGNTTSSRIYACAGYTGHGFSWAHGSAELLAKIITGEDVPPVARFFNPKSVF